MNNLEILVHVEKRTTNDKRRRARNPWQRWCHRLAQSYSQSWFL